MKKLFMIATASVGFLVGCGSSKSGDDFVGTWRAVGDVQKPGFYIADRLLVEKEGDAYKATLLAQGIFTKMKFNKDKGLLCSDKGACFEVKDKNTLRIGSTNGIKEYKREQ